MAKLSTSALRSAAASARNKSAENAKVQIEEELKLLERAVEKSEKADPKPSDTPSAAQESPEEKPAVATPAEEKPEPVAPLEEAPVVEPAPKTAAPLAQQATVGRGMLHSQDGERKTEHVNLLITPTLSRRIGEAQRQGGFRSKNAAVIAILEAYCDINEIQ